MYIVLYTIQIFVIIDKYNSELIASTIIFFFFGLSYYKLTNGWIK